MIKWMGPPFVATYKGIAKVLIRLHVHPNAVTVCWNGWRALRGPVVLPARGREHLQPLRRARWL